jgi:hypothetical protein
MGFTLNGLLSILRKFSPGTSGTPTTPTTGDPIGDANIGPALIALDYSLQLQNGQILMGATGTAALSNPTTGPTLTPSTGGSLAIGAYDVAYSYKNTYGETLASSHTTITLTSGQNRIVVTAITPPAGTTVNWYITDPGGATLKLHSNNSGAGFNINSVSGTSGTAPSSNTTASYDHAEKGTPTGSGGIALTTGEGTLDIAYNPIAPNDQNGFYLKRLRIENFVTSALPALTTADKGRLAFDTTVGTLKVWDGAAWQLMGGSGISTTLASAHIIVGNGSNIATDVALSGDSTITNAGVMTNTKINGVAVTGTPTTGQVPTATSGTAATWQTPSSTPADASTTVKGISKLSTAPASSTNPIAVGDNDSRMTDARTPIGTALTSGNIVLGNGSNVAAAVVPSGDISLSNAGVVAVNKVKGINVTNTPSASGKALMSDSTTDASWQTPPGGSAAAVAHGSAFPTSPAPSTNDQFIRDDLNTLSRYNGSSWSTIGGSGGGTFIGGKASASSSQSLSASTGAMVTFGTEDFDTDTMVTLGTNATKITINTTGIYQIIATASYDTSGTGVRQSTILKNGTAYIAAALSNNLSGSGTYHSFAAVASLTATDYLQLNAYSSDATNLTVTQAPASLAAIKLD